MRILFCTYHYPPSIGGVETQSALLARGLSARGHEVRVLTSGKPSSEHEGALLVRRVALPDRGILPMAAFALWLQAQVVAHARWADVIQVQQALPPAAVVSATARIIHTPVVVTNHGSGKLGAIDVMRKLPLGALGLRALRSATLVALTDAMAEEMRAEGLAPRAVIPNGIEIPPQPLEPRTRNALFIGRLDPIKGLDTLAEAARLLGDVPVDVVGDGPLRSQLGAPLVLHGAAKDVSPWLRRAGVFVLPSRAEGFGLALLEAMAHGCACVATDVDGSRALLAEGAGVLVPPGDAEALASAIRRLLDDPEAARALGARARSRAEQAFSARAMVDAYEQLYASLC
ncbi:MAG TPA: glycosyltransferase family 4 protein [Myxococcales bacterium]